MAEAVGAEVSLKKTMSPMAMLAILWFAHFANDALMGFWVIHKTLAGLDLVKSGLIASAALFLGNISQIAFGYLGDRGWRDVILPIGLLGSAAMCFLGTSENYIIIAAMVFVASLGSASFHPIAAGMAAQIDPPRRGTMVSIFITGGFIGYGLSQIVYSELYAAGISSIAFLAILPVTACALLCLLPKSEKKAVSGFRAMWKDSADKRGVMLILYLLVVSVASANLGMIFLLPEIMETYQASQFMIFGGAHFIMVVSGGIGVLPFGMLSDRIGPRQTMLIANVGSALAIILLLFSFGAGDLQLQIILGVFGLCSGASFPVAIAYGNALLPKHGSTVSAVFMGGAWALGSFGPTLLVWVAGDITPESIANALSVCLVFWVLAIIMSLILPRAKSFDHETGMQVK
ncbi:MAG: MFS transporter [Planctomycetes bacterium]|nr:MFS transporter [Planctomycetota bacterium]